MAVRFHQRQQAKQVMKVLGVGYIYAIILNIRIRQLLTLLFELRSHRQVLPQSCSCCIAAYIFQLLSFILHAQVLHLNQYVSTHSDRFLDP